MVVTVMETTYRNLKSRIVHYCDFKYFCNNSFKELLQKAISQNLGVGCDDIYGSFEASCNKILDNDVPLKKKYVRGNHSLTHTLTHYPLTSCYMPSMCN